MNRDYCVRMKDREIRQIFRSWDAMQNKKGGRKKKRKEKRNLTRVSHFSSERRGIRIFRENSVRPSSETRDHAYVCSTLLRRNRI